MCLTPTETLALSEWIREFRRTYEELAACAAAGDAGLPLAPAGSVVFDSREGVPLHLADADVAGIDDPDLGAIQRIFAFPILRTVRLRYPILCGEANAYYNSGAGTVTVCAELVALGDIATGDGGGIARFALAHEYLHALIDLARIPITGTEEAAADEGATVVLLAAGREADVEAAAEFWSWLAGQGIDEDPMDVHLSPARRAWDMKCLVQGRRMFRDKTLHDFFAQFGWGALECERRWSQKVRDWDVLLDYADRAG